MPMATSLTNSEQPIVPFDVIEQSDTNLSDAKRDRAVFLPRADALHLMTDNTMSDTLMVDTLNGTVVNMKPFSTMNPFYVWDEPVLPVPGQNNVYARSIESIWQGLKLVDGQTDKQQFYGTPHKRPSDLERRKNLDYNYNASEFKLGSQCLSLLEARVLIYLPSYLYLLENLVPDECISTIESHLRSPGRVVFYDWDANGDLLNTDDSFSHSSLLASWFNGSLEADFIVPATNRLKASQQANFIESISHLLNRYHSIHEGW